MIDEVGVHEGVHHADAGASESVGDGRCVDPELGLAADDFLHDEVVVQLGSEPQRIDLLTFVSGVEFDEAFEHRMLAEPGETQVPVIGRAELRRNKLATGRLRDQADLEDLGIPGPQATEDEPG